MSDIPSGICRQILLRLPAESLIRFRAVSKAWRAVIDDPSFVKAHTNNQLSSDTLLLRNSTGPPFYPLYSFNLDALSFANGPQTIPVTTLKLTRSGLSRLPALPVAACNGLMLIAPVDREINWDRKRNWDSKKPWEIWNPLTHERLELPQPNINIDSEVVGCGLGYDCAADDYKVVVIDYLDHDRKSVSQTHVYSLKSDSWRMIGDCPYDYLSGSCQQGVFLNGALHWGSEYGIIVLDVGTENYRQLPKAPRRGSPDSIQLDALGGCLILSYYRTDDYTKYFDVWMIKDYGAEGSWMKLISLQQCKDNSYLDSDLRPVAYMKNKRQVLLQHYYGFFWFDVESNSVKTVSIHGLSSDSSAQICPGSLVRLHDSCGTVAAKRRMRKRKSKRKMKMKMADTKLTFCVRDVDRDDHSLYPSHDSCYSLDSNWYYSSSEADD